MKKILLLFAATLVLNSCNKDDGGDSVSIEGSWEYFKEGYIDNSTEVLMDYQNDCSKDFIEILSDGVIKTHIFEMPVSICEEAISTGTWSRNGNTFVNTFDGESLTNEILELSDQYLKVKYYSDENQEYKIYIFKRL